MSMRGIYAHTHSEVKRAITEICVDELDVTSRPPYYFGMGLLTDNIKAMASRYPTQLAFGEAVGVSQPAVNRWLKGSIPEHENLSELAKLAGVTVETFTTVPARLWSGTVGSPLPSVGELTQMLDGIIKDLSPALPYGDWPRVVAQELHTRLATLASDRAIQLAQALQDEQDEAEGD